MNLCSSGNHYHSATLHHTTLHHQYITIFSILHLTWVKQAIFLLSKCTSLHAANQYSEITKVFWKILNQIAHSKG